MMTDLRKAAEMALEALETLWDILDDIDTTSDIAKENDAWYRKRVEFLQKKRWDTSITTDEYKLKGGVIEALRQALAQPEKYLKFEGPTHVVCQCNKCKSQTKQEPVARIPNAQTPFKPDPLNDYTAPPKREWDGLTEADIYESIGIEDEFEFAKAIEAKLKEKNT